MTEQLTLAVETPQPTWHRPPGRGGCARDPNLGPGSCTYWWEHCPKAAERGCFLLWARSEETQDFWLAKAPADWVDAPAELQAATAGQLRARNLIEVRQQKDGRWQWKRMTRAVAA